MKFGETLAVHLTPEWRSQYINYAKLKDIILQGVHNTPVVDENEPDNSVLKNYTRKLSETFFMACDMELKKINTFFSEKKSESLRHFYELTNGIQRFQREIDSSGKKTLGQMIFQRKYRNAMLNRYKTSASELYLHMVLIQNYQILNHTGFRKILKKYDKLTRSTEGNKWFLANVNNATFYTDRKLDHLILNLEDTFTDYLENGNRAEAMKRLRVPPLMETQDTKTVFRSGLFIGIVFCLLVVISVKLFLYTEYNDEKIQLLWHLHRGTFYALTAFFLFSMNIYIWRYVGINHTLIFELDPRRHLTYTDVLEISAIFAVIWSVSLYVTTQYKSTQFPLTLLPLAVLLVMVIYFILPLPILHWKSRYWFFKAVSRVVIAPFRKVGFVDFWLGDQLMSLTTCLTDIKGLLYYYILNNSLSQDFQYKQCFEGDYMGNAIVASFPPWFRLAQCLRRYYDSGDAYPFLMNGLKYFSNFPVIIFRALMASTAKQYEDVFQNPFVWCFLISSLISNIYSYLWDVLRDFHLFRTFRVNIFLRDNIIYSKSFYYFVIIENFVFRFSWVLDFYIVTNHILDAHLMQSISAFCEIIRRHIWNYIRLENEHLFNTGRFRAVRNIALLPVNFHQSLAELENIMDDAGNGRRNTPTRYNPESTTKKGA